MAAMFLVLLTVNGVSAAMTTMVSSVTATG